MKSRAVSSIKLNLFIILTLILSSCAQNFDQHDRTDPHVFKSCLMNADCPNGERCEKGYCEDIYFPRKDIKNY